MPLIFLLRLLFGLISLALLGLGGFLIWEWAEGAPAAGPDVSGAENVREREHWMLVAGAALLAWSFLGRPVMLLLLGRGGGEPPNTSAPDGGTIDSATGARLFTDADGPAGGPTLVLTHGWSLDATIWARLRANLAEGWRVVRWDLPGLGRSRRAPGGRIELDAMAEDLRAVIASAGGGPVVLIGHSIGGMTVQTLARNHPALFRDGPVAGVVLLNTTHTNPLRTMILSGLMRALRWPALEPLLRLCIVLAPLVWIAGWQNYLSGFAHLANRFAFAKRPRRGDLEHVTVLVTKAWPAVSARGTLAMLRWDAMSGPANMETPLLVIAGAADIVTKPEAGEAIAAMGPRAELRIVPAANHMGFVERDDVYADLIAGFVRGLRG